MTDHLVIDDPSRAHAAKTYPVLVRDGRVMVDIPDGGYRTANQGRWT
jgi:hypothetical protein